MTEQPTTEPTTEPAVTAEPPTGTVRYDVVWETRTRHTAHIDVPAGSPTAAALRLLAERAGKTRLSARAVVVDADDKPVYFPDELRAGVKTHYPLDEALAAAETPATAHTRALRTLTRVDRADTGGTP